MAVAILSLAAMSTNPGCLQALATFPRSRRGVAASVTAGEISLAAATAVLALSVLLGRRRGWWLAGAVLATAVWAAAFVAYLGVPLASVAYCVPLYLGLLVLVTDATAGWSAKILPAWSGKVLGRGKLPRRSGRFAARWLNRAAATIFLMVWFPANAIELYVLAPPVRVDPRARVVALCEGPVSFRFFNRGRQIAIGAGEEVVTVGLDGSDYRHYFTDRLDDTEFVAVDADERRLYIVDRPPRRVFALDTRDRAPRFREVRAVAPIPNWLDRGAGTAVPVALEDAWVLSLENGFFARCPRDPDAPCTFARGRDFHVAPTGPVPFLCPPGTVSCLDDAVPSPDRKTIYVDSGGPNFGIVVIDAKTLSLFEFMLPGEHVEWIEPCGSLLVCSLPLRSEIVVIDMVTQREIRRFGAFFGVNSLACDVEENRIFASSFFSPWIYAGDLTNGRFRPVYRIERAIKHIEYSPDARALFVLGESIGKLYRIDVP